MAESQSRNRDSQRIEAQPSSRLTAVYAVASAPVLVLVGLAILLAWPRWWSAESPSSSRGDDPNPPRYRRGYVPDESRTPGSPGIAATHWDDGFDRRPSRAGIPSFRLVRSGARPAPKPRGTAGGEEESGAAEPDSDAPEADASVLPHEESAPAETRARAGRRPAELEAAADEIEAAAHRTRSMAEAEADEAERRAMAAYETAEEAFGRGQITETALVRLREAASLAREHAEAVREAAEAAEDRELERAQRLRADARRADEPARQQARAGRD